MAKVIKISEMSKDFGMKAKDVIEGFKEIKIEKNSGASVSDVEFEVNGIYSYDRKVLKLDADTVIEVNKKLTY